MVNIMGKSIALVLIVWMLIGVAVSTPLAAKADVNAPLAAERVAEDGGFQSAGMRGCNGGPGGPGGPRPTTVATTAASG